jgi:hypothetical protein
MAVQRARANAAAAEARAAAAAKAALEEGRRLDAAQQAALAAALASYKQEMSRVADRAGSVDEVGDAHKVRTKLLRFVSDDIWGSRGRCRVISRSIAEYLVQAWDVRNSCKHNGAVLPLPSAPEGRGADGVDAMA